MKLHTPFKMKGSPNKFTAPASSMADMTKRVQTMRNVAGSQTGTPTSTPGAQPTQTSRMLPGLAAATGSTTQPVTPPTMSAMAGAVTPPPVTQQAVAEVQPSPTLPQAPPPAVAGTEGAQAKVAMNKRLPGLLG